MKLNKLPRVAGFGLAGLVGMSVASSGCLVYSHPYATRYGTTYATQPVVVAQPSAVVVTQPSVYATPIAQGTQVQGTLDASDPRNERGAAFDDYAITLSAGVPVVITTLGGQSWEGTGLLDVYTYLYFNGQMLAYNDDGAGYPHSRISFVPPYTGTYVIRVSTYGSGLRTGTYTLIVQ